ncbi:hypothetical protein H4S14_002432 [Agrobacterium vitis]|nr:hypothetical protein [Agrobacterium vitis]MBE1438682.1 hypothetical protein [Agrobacterium vitis]
MLKRAFGGRPPCILPDTPASGFHFGPELSWRRMKNQTNGASSDKLGSRLDESIPSTILTLISVVCCLCHIGKRQSLPSHNIDKSDTLEVRDYDGFRWRHEEAKTTPPFRIDWDVRAILNIRRLCGAILCVECSAMSLPVLLAITSMAHRFKTGLS